MGGRKEEEEEGGGRKAGKARQSGRQASVEGRMRGKKSILT